VVSPGAARLSAGFNLKEIQIKDLDVEDRRALSCGGDVVASDPSSFHPYAQADPRSGQRSWRVQDWE
jgi:hypothetical protein